MIHLIGDGIVARRAAVMLRHERFSRHRSVITSGVTGSGVAVLLHSGSQRDDAATMLDRGFDVVACSDHPRTVARLRELDGYASSRGRTLVVGAATSPGLSGLLARWQSDRFDSIDEIHVAIHGTAGPGCAREHHRSMRGTTLAWRDGSWERFVAGSGRELCWFPEPVGAKDCYRSRSADPVLLHTVFSEARRITRRRSARRRDRLTARLPMWIPAPPEGAIGALRVELRGGAIDGSRQTVVVGIAEYIATSSAAVAIAFARAALRDDLPKGVVVPGDVILPTKRILSDVVDLGVRLQEFTGIAHS